MSTKTLLFLIVLALGLGVLAWRAKSRLDAGDFETLDRLVPDVRAEQIVAFQLDHLERSVALRLERRGSDWHIVDPLEADADRAVVGELLEFVEEGTGTRIPEGGRDLELLGLAPPRAVLVVEWLLDPAKPQGPRESARIELGAIDLDQRSVAVRARGRLYRTSRRLDTALDVSEFDLLDPLVLDLSTEGIVELHRIGTVSAGNERFGIELHAFLDNDGWSAALPQRAALHPGTMQLLLTNVVRLRAERWLPAVERSAEDLADLGLRPPALRIEAVDGRGDKHAVDLGRSPSDVWVALREGDEDGSIAVLDAESAMRLTVPFELLLDRRLMRAPRAAIDHVTFLDADGSARLELRLDSSSKDERWSVTAGSGESFLADRILAHELLGRLERSLFSDALTVPVWEPEEVRGAFLFEGAGESWRVDVGPADVLAASSFGGTLVGNDGDAVHGPRVRRGGEETVFLGTDELLELLATEPHALRDLQLTAIDELGVTGLEVVGPDGEERSWERSPRGRWTRAGETDGPEAFEILGLLDTLLALRAERFVAATDFPPQPDVSVRVLHDDGGVTRFDLATVGEGEEARTLVRVPEVGTAALEAYRAEVAAKVARLLASPESPR